MIYNNAVRKIRHYLSRADRGGITAGGRTPSTAGEERGPLFQESCDRFAVVVGMVGHGLPGSAGPQEIRQGAALRQLEEPLGEA